MSKNIHAIVHPKRPPMFQTSATHLQSNNPHACARVVYGKPQSPMQEDSAPKIPATGILSVYQVVGSLLYYALAADCYF